MQPRRTKLLAGVFVFVLLTWVAQTVLIETPSLVHSKKYWRTVSAVQLRADIATGAVDLATIGVFGTDPLHWAAAWVSDAEIIGVLVEAGADINSRDKGSGRIALHLASISNPSTDVIRALVEAGADVNAIDSQNLRPLHLAATSNPNAQITAALIGLGADVTAVDAFGNTALHKAATNPSSMAAIEILRLAGVDFSQANREGYRALESAARENISLETVKYVYDYTPSALDDVSDGFGRNLLHLAAGSNANVQITEFILDQGVAPDSTDKFGLSAAHYAAGSSPEPKVLALLIDRGTDINQANSIDQFTPLHYAAAFNKSLPMVKMLIDNGADADARAGNELQTALHLCLISQNTDEVCTYLAGLDGQMHLRDSHDYTALHHALLSDRSTHMLRTMIELGADVSATTQHGVSVLDLVKRKRLTAELDLGQVVLPPPN